MNTSFIEIMSLSQAQQFFAANGINVEIESIKLGRLSFDESAVNGYVVFYTFVNDIIFFVKAFSNREKIPRMMTTLPRANVVKEARIEKGNHFKAIGTTVWEFKKLPDGDCAIILFKD